jgi:hypothetical protein
VVFNFTPVAHFNYRLGVPRGGLWRELLNSDATEYGGSGQGNLGGVEAAPVPVHGRPWSLTLTLPPLGALFLKSDAPKPAEPETPPGEARRPGPEWVAQMPKRPETPAGWRERGPEEPIPQEQALEDTHKDVPAGLPVRQEKAAPKAAETPAAKPARTPPEPTATDTRRQAPASGKEPTTARREAPGSGAGPKPAGGPRKKGPVDGPLWPKGKGPKGEGG